MKDYILEQFKKLTSIDSPSGFTDKVSDYTANQFKQMGYKVTKTNKGCVAVDLGGDGNPITLSAHIDTLGGMVAEIKSNGRLRLAQLGGLSANNCEAENCKIYARNGKTFSGCLQLINASVHVNGEYGKTVRSFENTEVVIDEKTSSAEQTEALGIAVGDIVCFDPRTVITDSGYVKSRFIDDKMSVAVLLAFAKYVAEKKIKLSRKIYLFITVFEEVGHGCSYLPFDTEEILCVDMGCVGNGLTCDEHKVSICAKDSSGPYNYALTTALINCAKQNKIDYAVDVYPHYGSDASAALSAGADVRHALIGSGVYASHGYERTHVDGINNTFNLLIKYLCE